MLVDSHKRKLARPQIIEEEVMSQLSGVRLGKRGLEIMNIVWDLGEATVQDVVDRLERPAAYSTVLTMMRALESKGLLGHRTFGRTFIYRPEMPREQVR